MPPERVQKWLEGLDVESRDLADYDEMVEHRTNHEEYRDEEDEESTL